MLEGQHTGSAFSTVAEKRLSHRSWWGTTSSHNATVHLCVTLALHTDRRGTSLKGWWFITYVLCFIVTEQAVLESEVRVQRKDRKLLTKSRSCSGLLKGRAWQHVHAQHMSRRVKTQLTAETADNTSCTSLYLHLSIYLSIHHSITQLEQSCKLK